MQHDRRTDMKAFVLAAVATIGLATAPSKADFWFDGLGPGFGVPDSGPHHGGPYFVAGFGNEHADGPRRYWGGPYFAPCSGWHPPFETYRMVCKPVVAKIAIREHRRSRVRLK
jgi:hypothetical protein